MARPYIVTSAHDEIGSAASDWRRISIQEGPLLEFGVTAPCIIRRQVNRACVPRINACMSPLLWVIGTASDLHALKHYHMHMPCLVDGLQNALTSLQQLQQAMRLRADPILIRVYGLSPSSRLSHRVAAYCALTFKIDALTAPSSMQATT